MNETIKFYTADFPIPVRNRGSVKASLHAVAKSYGFSILSLNYIFCSDDYLLEVNRTALQHDYYTDIITFDLREKFTSKTVVGEIYISVDRVKENASEFGVSFKNELHRVMSHGLLHLIGFKDKSEEEEKEMRSAEDNALKLFI